MAWVAWTVTTLVAQLRGEVLQARDAAGGAEPDRLVKIVEQALEAVENSYDWLTADTPPNKDMLWYLLGLAMAQRSFVRSETWRGSYRLYENELQRSIGEDNKARWVLVAPTAAAPPYTDLTLAKNVLGELRLEIENQKDRPELVRAQALARLAGKFIWEYTDWRWALKAKTLVFADTDTNKVLESDFRKLATHKTREASQSGWLTFTSDALELQAKRDLNPSVTGCPELAVVVPKTGETTFTLHVEIWPTSDGAYTFPYWYYVICPWDDKTFATAPWWPVQFDVGWHLLTRAYCRRAFVRGDGWMGDMQKFQLWLDEIAQQVDNPVEHGAMESLADADTGMEA